MSVVTFIGNKCAVYALVRAAARVSHTANYDEKLGRGPCCPSRVTAATHNLVEEPVDIYICLCCRRLPPLQFSNFHRTPNFQVSQCKCRASSTPVCYFKRLVSRDTSHHCHCGARPACLLMTGHSAPPHCSGAAAVCSCLWSDDGDRKSVV